MLTGKETHTHTWAWVEEGRLERRAQSRPPRPASHTPGNAVAALARAILSAELDAAGPGRRRSGGGTRGGRRARAARQEARRRRLVTALLGAHGCAREPGGQASAPLSRAPGAWAPRHECPRCHPRARPAGLSGARAADIHLSVQGQDRNSASGVLRTGNFSLTRCRPSPTPGFKTKQKPSASSQHTQSQPAAASAPPPSGRPPRLGPGPGSGELAGSRAPSTGGSKQIDTAGRLGSGPTEGAQLPPSRAPPGSGGGAQRRRLRALLSEEPGRAASQRCRRPPGQRLPGARGWGRRPRGACDLANPAAGTGRAANSAWQSSRGNSMFRNSSRVAGGQGEENSGGPRGLLAPACHSPRGSASPPSLIGSQEGGDGRSSDHSFVYALLFPPQSEGNF